MAREEMPDSRGDASHQSSALSMYVPLKRIRNPFDEDCYGEDFVQAACDLAEVMNRSHNPLLVVLVYDVHGNVEAAIHRLRSLPSNMWHCICVFIAHDGGICVDLVSSVARMIDDSASPPLFLDPSEGLVILAKSCAMTTIHMREMRYT